MEKHWNILFLSNDDVISLGSLDMKEALRDMEDTFSLLDKGEAMSPAKAAMGFGKTLADESTMGRINALPGYVGGRFQMAGLKWMGSYPGNIERGLPVACALTVLNDPDTKFPIAAMDGSTISAIRTGAVGGVAAKYLAKKTSRTLMLIGAGYQSTTQLEGIYLSCPTLKNFYIVDIYKERAESFAQKMGQKLGIEITPLTNASDCKEMPDITVTATNSNKPVIDCGVVQPGCFHISVGGCDHPDLYKKADKIVVDSWYHVYHRGLGSLVAAVDKGDLKPEQIYCREFGKIVNGKMPGRENDREIIYFDPVGMGCEDVAVASRIYRKAVEQGKGASFRLF